MKVEQYNSFQKARNFQIFGIIALAVSVFGYTDHPKEFMFSFLTSSYFWLSISLGAIFFVLLHHLVSAKWSVLIRRFAEQTMVLVPWIGLIMLPVMYLGAKYLFPWADETIAATDHIIHKKHAYLNLPFFYIRGIIYFASWTLIAYGIRYLSLKHDQDGSQATFNKMKGLSAPAILVYAFTVTFSGFDWIMSLDPHWYSTIFGVYMFAGCVVAIMAFLNLITIYLHHCKGHLQSLISEEHYHDLGKMLFAFTCFWAYIAFSQYVLIWYGNIPEETVWYAHRSVDSWKYLSIFIALGHFVVPFMFLLPRPMKRNKKIMVAFSVWMLFMHLLDLVWLIYPNLYHHGYHFHWFDLTLMLGFGFFFIGRVLYNLSKSSLYPINDPLLQESIDIIS